MLLCRSGVYTSRWGVLTLTLDTTYRAIKSWGDAPSYVVSGRWPGDQIYHIFYIGAMPLLYCVRPLVWIGKYSGHRPDRSQI